jgi:hypothetical protein
LKATPNPLSEILFLRFRLAQLYAVFKDIPWAYKLAVIAGVGIGLSSLLAVTDSNGTALLEAAIFWLIILAIHLRRKDYRFIHIIAPRPWLTFSVDYAMITSPIWAVSAWKGFMFASMSMLAACIATGLLKQLSTKTLKIPVPRAIPCELYETRSGFRRYGIWMLLLYFLAWTLAFLEPYLSIFFLWLMICLPLDFFRTGEPLSILCCQEHGARRFIRHKLAINLRFYFIALAPVCLTAALIHPQTAWLPCIFIFAATLNIALYILVKYACYQPSKSLEAGRFSVALSILGMLALPLSPITVILIIRYCNPAIKNLEQYLNAYDR